MLEEPAAWCRRRRRCALAMVGRQLGFRFGPFLEIGPESAATTPGAEGDHVVCDPPAMPGLPVRGGDADVGRTAPRRRLDGWLFPDVAQLRFSLRPACLIGSLLGSLHARAGNGSPGNDMRGRRHVYIPHNFSQPPTCTSPHVN